MSYTFYYYSIPIHTISPSTNYLFKLFSILFLENIFVAITTIPPQNADKADENIPSIILTSQKIKIIHFLYPHL